MYKMTLGHYIGAAIVLGIITAAGIYSGRKVKSASDFMTGGKKAGAGIVTGAILGTLIGGASTIGTSQLAFTYGFSAWWYTLGAGIGCLILGLFYAKPFYESGHSTLPGIIGDEYGKKAAAVSTILMSVGIFLSIVSQFLSGVVLITSVSHFTAITASMMFVALTMFYVIFGGVWGAGIVGVVKLVLLYVSVVVCGLLAINYTGGFAVFKAMPEYDGLFSLFARGVLVDGGAGISLVLGVLCTQSYIQAVLAARTVGLSKKGAIVSALLLPPVGVFGIFVGMYMRVNFPDISSAAALPTFVMEYLPPFAAGAVMATLLVALMGTGAGAALGISSMISNDIYKKYFNKTASDSKTLTVNRIIIALILIASALCATGNAGSLILSWSFMSMGLRASVAFFPVCGALFLKGKIDKGYAFASIILSPLAVLGGKFFLPPNIDSLFAGMAASALLMILGYVKACKR